MGLQRKIRCPQILAAGLAVLLAGCMSPKAIRPVKPDYWTRQTTENAMTKNELSEQTLNYLSLRDWDNPARKNPRQVLLALRAQLIAEPDRTGLTSLAELAYYAGVRAKSPDEKSEFFLTATRAAYATLFDPEMGPQLDALDPNLRMAADLYNYSLSRVLNILLQNKETERNTVKVKTISGSVSIRRGHGITNAPAIHDVLVAFSYKTDALRRHNRRRGLGVPLVVVREKEPLVPGETILHPPVTEAQIAPSTALLLFSNPWKNSCESEAAVLELWNSLTTTCVQMEDRSVPLEADTSLSLALLYAEHESYRGILNMPRFLRGGFMTDKRGLFLLEPYSENKIPVVFIHGLMDSPLTWLPMLNELFSDPILKQRYQFWVFFYPTMNPILQSASELRESLNALHRQMSATRKAWDDMVLVGHSMGGLITRLNISDSDAHFDTLLQNLLDASEGDPELRDYVQKLSTFTPLPFVQRAVFMGTPHAGAMMAKRIGGRTGSALMSRPDYIQNFLDSKDGRIKAFKHTENGIDNLRPKSPFTLGLKASSWNSDIPVHSIIGDVRKAGRTNGTDSVVAYSSAHIEGVQSEIVVEADHLTLHKKTPAIAEVRRILFEHIVKKP